MRAVHWANGSGLEGSIDLVASKGLLALVTLVAAVALWAFFRSRRRFWTLVSAGAGVIAAYALSEGIKVLVAEPRPCTAADLATVIACPAAGDWSWPSNHAVLAAAFATACISVLTRAGWVAVPIAVGIAVSRVLAGVHYAHDVLSGLALGMLVVAGVVIAIRPLLDRMLAAAGDAESKRDGWA
ncbi:MAG TPA: phosphatase PAP2 family protein [Candidatus Dietzia intestinipullorum]|nr:phosphatase PAP2 family protein [Candidatus Dietzia merdigallinarum]HJC30149.1 phosphatase PAP2 family protein [Candidatus Dietzia intestinipullorum]